MFKVYGWEDGYTYSGDTSGTTGKGLRNEALKVKLVNKPTEESNIKYEVYVEGRGWTGIKKDDEVAGTTGQGLRIEALKIELENIPEYSVKYRIHMSNIGWTSWKKDGEQIGNISSHLQIEAVEIKVEKKNSNNNNNTSTIKKGIDVSVYQNNINWAKVKQDGIEFAMIRAGFRGYGQNGTLVTDSFFTANIRGALENKIKVGVYFFTQAVNEQEAIEEANYVLNLIRGYNVTYPIAIDTENVPNAVGRADNLSKELRTRIIAAFCNRVKEAGYEPMIYANKWWLNAQLDMSKLSEYNVWLAHYTGATQDNPLAKPSDYTGKYIMWQYTDKAIVNGINGNVDANITY